MLLSSGAWLAATAIAGLLACPYASAQNVDVAPLPFLGGEHHRWYIWLVVSIAGVTLIYTAFFVIRGFLVARKRKKMFRAGGISDDDHEYTAKHAAILAKLLPRSKMPQGKGSTNYSPMLSTMEPWDGSKRQPGSVESSFSATTTASSISTNKIAPV